MLFVAIDGLTDGLGMFAQGKQIGADEGQVTVKKTRTAAKILCAVALHFDDDVLRVGLGFAGDGERSDAGDGVLLGALDGHRISSACRKAKLLSASKLVSPQTQGHTSQRWHSSSWRSTAIRLRASTLRVAQARAFSHAFWSASTESAPTK